MTGTPSVLLTPDHAGNVVGVDPHKRSLSATVVDPRGGLLAGEHFRVSGDGHRALEAWARQFGPIARWGIERLLVSPALPRSIIKVLGFRCEVLGFFSNA